MYDTYGYGHAMGLYGVGSAISSILWFIILLAIAVIVVRWAFGFGGMRRMRRWQMWQQMQGKGSALDILQERYAKGEINKQEYEEKKKDLTS